MNSWRSSSLGQLASTFAGGTPSRAVEDYYGGNIPWVKSTEVNQDYITETSEFLTELGLKNSNCKLAPNDSVLIAMYGATAGQVSKLQIAAATNQAVLAIVCGEDLDSAFLYYVLNHNKNKILYLAQGSGQPNLSKELIDKTEIVLPNPNQQQKIANILSTVDNLVEQTQNIIDKYTAVKQGMMADLFSRGIDLSGTPETNKNYGQLRPSCEDAPDLYHESELGWVPKIWEEAPLREQLVNIEQGWSPDCDSEGATEGWWGVLKTTSVVWEGFDFSANKALPSELTPKKEYEIKAGDVLMTRAGPGNRVGVVVHVSNTRNKLLLSDKLYRIIPKERIGKPFLALLLSSELIQKQINATKTGLAESQSNISQHIVKKLKVFIPSIREQELIVGRMSAINEKIDTEKKYLNKLELEKKGLMQDLLTGKVKV
ncbi:hypothetical protein C7Y69_09395 [Alteromonas sp. KS69]|uniref:restriction endonuclease subunit S n=1 Tax=Alteromonas sp. KS69 TaxID=2109917 RepID=UPI000F888F6D|nr:restriction endonuclease subunit S [Alteromonas sp. KS69]RUP81349.1 hypothetical protein C7Y69_09395 [Alteromonas sp. KS69]|tara:strand:- start:19993 stop:21279 length:1287 start_codon:yes stop_codon:yes gene_type:complete